MKRVRFAPSPTGTLHIGNALSAVANRGFGDWMLLRIDDTDPARNVPGGEEAIVDDLGLARRRLGRGAGAPVRARRAVPRGGGAARHRPVRGRDARARGRLAPRTSSPPSSTTSTSGSRTSSAGTTTGRTRRCTARLARALGNAAARVRPPRADPRRGREEAVEAGRGRDGRVAAGGGHSGRGRARVPRGARAAEARRPPRPAAHPAARDRGDRGDAGRELAARVGVDPQYVPVMRGARDLIEAREYVRQLEHAGVDRDRRRRDARSLQGAGRPAAARPRPRAEGGRRQPQGASRSR